MKNTKFGEITVEWLTVRDLLKNNEKEDALKLLDDLLAKFGKLTLNGVKEIDGVSLDLWKERVWLEIEKNYGLPEIDEDIKFF